MTAKHSLTDLNCWLDRVRANGPHARDEFIEGCQGRLRRLTLKIWRNFSRLHGLEEPSDALQNASIRLLRRLKQATPNSVDDFFRLAARAIHRELIGMVRHHFGPQGDAAHQVGVEDTRDFAALDVIVPEDPDNDPPGALLLDRDP